MASVMFLSQGMKKNTEKSEYEEYIKGLLLLPPLLHELLSVFPCCSSKRYVAGRFMFALWERWCEGVALLVLKQHNPLAATCP